MGNKKVITEGKELESMKKQAVMFEQLNYAKKEYKLELKGIESVEGVNCYKIVVTDKDGDSTTEFYDVKSNFLIRTVKSQDGPQGQQVSIITDYKEYKDVSGIMIPFKSVINGAMPVPLELEATLIEWNKEIAADIFKVE